MVSIIVENGDFSVLLVEKGADVDVYSKDDHKATTLLQLSHRGMIPVVEALLATHGGSSGEENSLMAALHLPEVTLT